MAVRVEGLIFAGVGSADHDAVASFFADALGVEVDVSGDVEAATDELAARGIEPDGELNAGYGLRYRHFRAPDGRRFELLDRKV